MLAVSVLGFDIGAQLWLCQTLGLRYTLFGFFLPVIIQNLLLTYFLLGTHLTSQRSKERDPVLGSLSLRMPWWLAPMFLDAGRHTEHHLFPTASHRNLQQVTAALKEHFPERFREADFFDSARALEASGRVYVGDDLLWDPFSDRLSTVAGVKDFQLTQPKVLSITGKEHPSVAEALHEVGHPGGIGAHA